AERHGARSRLCGLIGKKRSRRQRFKENPELSRSVSWICWQFAKIMAFTHVVWSRILSSCGHKRTLSTASGTKTGEPTVQMRILSLNAKVRREKEFRGYSSAGRASRSQ